jgi:hypothetical protein
MHQQQCSSWGRGRPQCAPLDGPGRHCAPHRAHQGQPCWPCL